MVKKFLKSFGLFLLIANLALLIAVPAYAQEGVGQLIREVGGKTGLPDYEAAGHAGASYEEGATGITSAILMVTDALKYLMGTIAVIVLIVSGVRLITSTRQVEEVATKQKENIKYAIIGLIIISVADFAVKNIFFGEAGEVFRSESEAQLAEERGQELFRGMYRMGEYVIGAIAVLMIVINGIRLVVTGGSEDQIGKAKKNVMYAIFGLVLIGVAELVVFDIIFPEVGEALPRVQRARQLIVTLTNFISGFIATVAIAMYMYGGFLYVTAAGQEDMASKAKKVFISATIGLIIALGAFAIVNSFIRLEPLAETPVSETVAPGGIPGLTQP